MTNDNIDIKNVGGDVIGAGISGTGNFVGREIHYTVKGNVFNIDNPSGEALLELKKVLAQKLPKPVENDVTTENTKTLNELKNLQESMDEILKLVKSTDDKLGTRTEEIQVADHHISRVDLLVKKAIVLMEQASLYLNTAARDSNINWHSQKYKEALYILRQANSIDPFNTEILLYMAKIQAKLSPNNSNAVRKILYRVQNLLEIPKTEIEKFQLGEATFLLAVSGEQISNKLLADARIIFEELGRKDWVRKCEDLLRSYDDKSDDQSIWTEKAWTLGKLGKYHEAIKSFDMAINVNPNDLKIWRGKGSVLARLGQYELAIRCYDRGIELDPTDAGLLKSKGTCYFYLENYEQALNCFERALDIGQDENTLIGKARILRKLGLYDQAIQSYDEATSINPNNGEAYYGKGQAFHDLGKNEDAIECYDKALEKDPDNSIVWYSKGEALRKMGMENGALKCYEKVIEIEPDHVDAKNSKLNILEKRGKG